MKIKSEVNILFLLVLLLLIIGLIFVGQKARAIELDELKISDIQTSDITGGSVVITWKTNRVADGLVEFGEDEKYSNYVKETGPLNLDHGVTLGGLKEKTTYYFRAKSVDGYGNSVVSFGHSFKTEKSVDETKPVISQVKLQYVTDTTAVVSWETDEKASGIVYYGYQSDGENYKWKKSASSGIKHLAIINNLKPMTYYNYQARSKDSSGNWAYSNNYEFSTVAESLAKETELKFSNIKPLSANDGIITQDAAVIEWHANKLAKCELYYGKSIRQRKKITIEDYETDFRVQLKDLEPETIYYFQISCKDVFNKSAKSNDMTFITKPEPAKPPGLEPTEAKKEMDGHAFSRPDALYKAAGDPRVYAIFSNKKHHIASPELFLKYGYQWADIKVVDQKTLDGLPNVRLVKSPQSATVYYLYQKKSRKKAIASPSVFNSYPANKWDDIITLSAEDINRYQEARLVKTSLSPTVYFLEGNIKRPVKNVVAFEKNNFQWDEIFVINQADIDSYFTGDFLE